MPNAPSAHQPAAGGSNLALLILVGTTVFGTFWQKPMSEYVGMSQRHMVRWGNGQWPVPDVLMDGRHITCILKDLIDEHQKKVDVARARVLAALPEGGRPGT